MKKEEYLTWMTFPLKSAILKKYPQGNIRQYWSESPELYSEAFGYTDDFHLHLGGHSGLDIATFEGEEVLACQSGKVVHVVLDVKNVGGNQVFIESPVLEDTEPVVIKHVYAHLKDVLVQKGQEVVKGQVIGHEGNTGFVVAGGTPFWGNAPAGEGVHLHFGMYELIQKSGVWTIKYEAMMGSFDPLPWFTDSNPNDEKIEGNWGGTISVLQKMIELLMKWKRS